MSFIKKNSKTSLPNKGEIPSYFDGFFNQANKTKRRMKCGYYREVIMKLNNKDPNLKKKSNKKIKKLNGRETDSKLKDEIGLTKHSYSIQDYKIRSNLRISREKV